jgi:hypothetical protein
LLPATVWPFVFEAPLVRVGAIPFIMSSSDRWFVMSFGRCRIAEAGRI